jgi:hypothetical protein
MKEKMKLDEEDESDEDEILDTQNETWLDSSPL